jgi:hypothetical protein
MVPEIAYVLVELRETLVQLAPQVRDLGGTARQALLPPCGLTMAA